MAEFWGAAQAGFSSASAGVCWVAGVETGLGCVRVAWSASRADGWGVGNWGVAGWTSFEGSGGRGCRAPGGRGAPRPAGRAAGGRRCGLSRRERGRLAPLCLLERWASGRTAWAFWPRLIAMWCRPLMCGLATPSRHPTTAAPGPRPPATPRTPSPRLSEFPVRSQHVGLPRPPEAPCPRPPTPDRVPPDPTIRMSSTFKSPAMPMLPRESAGTREVAGKQNRRRVSAHQRKPAIAEIRMRPNTQTRRPAGPRESGARARKPAGMPERKGASQRSCDPVSAQTGKRASDGRGAAQHGGL